MKYELHVEPDDKSRHCKCSKSEKNMVFFIILYNQLNIYLRHITLNHKLTLESYIYNIKVIV